jgi:peptide-methionine (S)-S-oxide reductase
MPRVGHIGGHPPDRTHEKVRSHATGHAEAFEMWSDPHKVSYAQPIGAVWRFTTRLL